MFTVRIIAVAGNKSCLLVTNSPWFLFVLCVESHNFLPQIVPEKCITLCRSTSGVFLAEGTGTERTFCSAICKQQCPFVSSRIPSIGKSAKGIIVNNWTQHGNFGIFQLWLNMTGQNDRQVGKFDWLKPQIDRTLFVDQPLFSDLHISRA